MLNELLTPDEARDYYGVVLAQDDQGDPVVDQAATEACRRQRSDHHAAAGTPQDDSLAEGGDTATTEELDS